MAADDFAPATPEEPKRERVPVRTERKVFLTLTMDEARALKLALETTYPVTSLDVAGLTCIGKLRKAVALAEDHWQGRNSMGLGRRY